MMPPAAGEARREPAGSDRPAPAPRELTFGFTRLVPGYPDFLRPARELLVPAGRYGPAVRSVSSA